MVAILTKKGPSVETDHTSLQPARLICIDIETGHADPEVIEDERKRWKAPSNMKDPVKIEEKRKEFALKIAEKSALLDASPVVCISARTEKVGKVFNGVDKKVYKVNHSEVISAGNEKQMLEAFREWLDNVSMPDTILIGFNIFAFDIPRLRAAYMRHRLRLPKILTPRILDEERQPAVDVMRLFLKSFTADCHHDIMISLDEVVHRLGLPHYKGLISGAQVPDFIKDGKVKEVLTYCAIDTMATLQAYLLMTSSAGDMS